VGRLPLDNDNDPLTFTHNNEPLTFTHNNKPLTSTHKRQSFFHQTLFFSLDSLWRREAAQVIVCLIEGGIVWVPTLCLIVGEAISLIVCRNEGEAISREHELVSL